MKKIAVFCSGNGSNFEAILQAIRKKSLRVEVALMVCDNPKAFALKRAEKFGVPVCCLSPKLFSDRESFERVVVSILRSQSVDLVVLAGFMRILTPYFISQFKDRIINIHPSYLPAFKGAHAIRDAFTAGVEETGVTVHVVTAEVDSGKIILQKKVKILPKDTLAKLEKRIHQVEHALYPAAIGRYLRS